MEVKGIYLSMFILALTDFVQITLTKTVHKRDLMQMCELIKHHTGTDSCLAFNDYGCFCGYGWAEHLLPLDSIDNCCLQHDVCYMNVDCWFRVPQILPYQFTCENGHCTCTDDNTFWRMCRRDLCECDLELARCLGRTQHVYNNTYKNYRFCDAEVILS